MAPMIHSLQHVAAKKPLQSTALAVDVPTDVVGTCMVVYLVPHMTLPSSPKQLTICNTQQIANNKQQATTTHN